MEDLNNEQAQEELQSSWARDHFGGRRAMRRFIRRAIASHDLISNSPGQESEDPFAEPVLSLDDGEVTEPDESVQTSSDRPPPKV
jgi:hypothetical protein